MEMWVLHRCIIASTVELLSFQKIIIIKKIQVHYFLSMNFLEQCMMLPTLFFFFQLTLRIISKNNFVTISSLWAACCRFSTTNIKIKKCFVCNVLVTWYFLPQLDNYSSENELFGANFTDSKSAVSKYLQYCLFWSMFLPGNLSTWIVIGRKYEMDT